MAQAPEPEVAQITYGEKEWEVAAVQKHIVVDKDPLDLVLIIKWKKSKNISGENHIAGTLLFSLFTP